MVHSKATVDEFNEICIRENKCCEDNFCFEVLTHEFFDFTGNFCFYCLRFFLLDLVFYDLHYIHEKVIFITGLFG